VGPFQLEVMGRSTGGLLAATRRAFSFASRISAPLSPEGADAGLAALEALLEYTQEVLGARWVALLAPGTSAAAPEVLASVGTREGDATRAVSGTVLEQLRSQGGPVVSTDVRTDARFVEAPSLAQGVGVASVLAAEVRRGRARAGIVYAESGGARGPFTELERATVADVCVLASQLLEQAAEVRLARGTAWAWRRLQQATTATGAEVPAMLAVSPAMQALGEELNRVGPTDSAVLLQGETGAGKEMAARALHQASPRRDGPFVAINCAAIPAELFEAELFGHRSGAFSGAAGERPGRFELARGGTLFLDEVGDLAPASQGKLLRVLETGTVQRLGDSEARPVDFRVVTATHRDLLALVERGDFRKDLYFRLAVYPLVVPPLRDRPLDIPPLASRFLDELESRYRRGVQGFAPAVEEALRRHRWPGNVRELRNLVEQAYVAASPPLVQLEDLRFLADEAADGSSYPDELEAARSAFEEAHIRRILGQELGVVARAAARLGLTRPGLSRKLGRLGIDAAVYRSSD
jgi:transcriptional regulator with GAF, ATPase, and Fis domain